MSIQPFFTTTLLEFPKTFSGPKCDSKGKELEPCIGLLSIFLTKIILIYIFYGSTGLLMKVIGSEI